MKKKIVSKVKKYKLEGLLAAGEDLVTNISLSTLCVDCIDDPPTGEEKRDFRAYYIYHGKGLCERHLEQEKNKV